MKGLSKFISMRALERAYVLLMKLALNMTEKASFLMFGCNLLTLWPLFMDGVQLPLLFTTKFPEIPGTHFINIGKMKD